MDNLAGIGAALAAMRGDDGRYDGAPMLSALPDAPIVSDRPTIVEHLRRMTRMLRISPSQKQAGGDPRSPSLRLRSPDPKADVPGRVFEVSIGGEQCVAVADRELCDECVDRSELNARFPARAA